MIVHRKTIGMATYDLK